MPPSQATAPVAHAEQERPERAADDTQHVQAANGDQAQRMLASEMGANGRMSACITLFSRT